MLDLGSGSGLTAIAAMQAGAAGVLAADIDRMALAAIRLNAALNGVEVATTDEDLLAKPPEPYDVVLVGDLFYERTLADLVLRFIDAAAAQGAVVLIGDPQRNYFPKGRFVSAAEYRVPVTRELEDAEIKRTSVWRLGLAARRRAARLLVSGPSHRLWRSAMEFAGMNVYAILLAAVASFMFGWLWYGVLFSGAWLEACGKSPEEVKGDTPSPTPFIISFVGLVVMACVLAGVLRHLGAEASDLAQRRRHRRLHVARLRHHHDGRQQRLPRRQTPADPN